MGSLAVIKYLVDNEHQLERDSLRDREPVKLFQNSCSLFKQCDTYEILTNIFCVTGWH